MHPGVSGPGMISNRAPGLPSPNLGNEEIEVWDLGVQRLGGEYPGHLMRQISNT